MTPAIRISIGVAAMSVCLVFLADTMLGIFPDTINSELEARKRLSESLGIQFAAIAAEDAQAEMLPAMRSAVAATEQLLSIGLRDPFGELLEKTVDHESLWQPDEEDRSTPSHIRIPIFRNDNHWGTLEVRFEPLPSMGVVALLQSPLYKLVAVMGIFGFVAYLLYLSRTLRYLDPGSVVPGRVRTALDQLVEGAVIVDHNQRIVLVNKAFADKVGRSSEDLLGVDPSSLDWLTAVASTLDELPWVTVKRTGERATDVRLQLNSPKLGVRTLSANVSPIADGDGRQRGMLLTFDDISETERINQELQGAVHTLQATQTELKRKNVELVRLATEDPLTGCLNRRALFEKLESEFHLAGQDGFDLSVVMVDIDHFKSVNDDFGHSVGDEVIKAMAGALSEFCGANGCVGRYGGEEFCMVLVKMDLESTVEVANRVRVVFGERSAAEGSPTGGRKITASFGVSTLSSGAADVAALVNQADEALYQSKRGGRNQVTIWADSAAPQRDVG